MSFYNVYLSDNIQSKAKLKPPILEVPLLSPCPTPHPAIASQMSGSMGLGMQYFYINGEHRNKGESADSFIGSEFNP